MAIDAGMAGRMSKARRMVEIAVCQSDAGRGLIAATGGWRMRI